VMKSNCFTSRPPSSMLDWMECCSDRRHSAFSLKLKEQPILGHAICVSSPRHRTTQPLQPRGMKPAVTAPGTGSAPSSKGKGSTDGSPKPKASSKAKAKPAPKKVRKSKSLKSRSPRTSTEWNPRW
jgi:hypothetical protein